MIVVVLLGIGICLLVLMKGNDQTPSEGDTVMTNQQIADMIRDNEKARRRECFERGTGYGTRIEHRRSSDVRGNKGNQRAAYRGEI